MNSIPSIKSSIFYIFETYFGIHINLSNFSLDQDNNLFIQLENINLSPNIINNNYLKNINIKITKGIIEKLELKIGINAFEIKLSKLILNLMPVISINKEKKEEQILKKEIKEKKESENDENNKKGIISSFIDYYLSKLKISINEMELIAFNYEITNKNLTYANPVLSLNIYNIKYDKGKIEENYDTSYIRKNIWENKHFSINKICLKIRKTYIKDNDDENENNLNNDNIMIINAEKGIHFYTNNKNEILGEIGDIQFIINLFQLELIKNFVDSYNTYLNIGKNKSKEIKKDNNNDNDINVTNKSLLINKNKNNNEIMNLKISLNSISLIILERNQNPTEVKLNEYNKDKMYEHFCYFEDNFFIFILYNLVFQYNNINQTSNATLEEISLNYIEYTNKEKKEEEIELINRTGSQFSQSSEKGIFKNNEIFKSIQEDGINFKEYYCSYDYRFEKNQIFNIKNIRLELNQNLKDKKKINFEVYNIFINFHPIYMFKVLKLMYENSFLIKEVLFYNFEQINDDNKIKKGNYNNDENIIIENDINDKKDNDIIIKKTENKNNNVINEHKKNENDDNLNLSFLSFEEDEDDSSNNNIIKNNKKDEKKDLNINLTKEENIVEKDNNTLTENKNNNANKNEVFISEVIFDTNPSSDDDNIAKKEKINEKLKKLLLNITFEIKIRVIEVKISSFKCEENFYNIINPYFNEFYYEHIYIMDLKDDFKQKKLKLNEVSSKDYFNIMIKNINIKNNYDEKNKEQSILVKFYPLIFSFSNNKILESFSDSFPIKYNLEENKLNINLKIIIFFKVKLFPYIISFINIWKYTFLIFEIFEQRMIYNYLKGKEELEKMNFENDILNYIERYRNKKNIKTKNNIYSEYDDENLLNIDIKIPSIKINLDIITKKIKANINLKNIGIICDLNNLGNKINFTLDDITSDEFNFDIKLIEMNLITTKIKNIDTSDIINPKNIQQKNRMLLQNKKSKNSINFNIVSPGESIEIYIENILRFKQKQKELNKENDIKKYYIKTDIKISIKSIKIKPIESILYLNDIYNVIGREEIYSNNNNNEMNKMLLNKSMQRFSASSYGSKKSKKKNIDIINSIVTSNNNNNDKNKKNEFNINFGIDTIKLIIADDTTFKSTELGIYNISLKKNIFNIKLIDFIILYETKDFGEKVGVNLSQIKNVNLAIIEKLNSNYAYDIIIDSIEFYFCKDSLSYLQNLLDIFNKIISNCFVQTKKNNKIVISQKKDVLLGMRDTKGEDEQELEIFGDNEAKSVCLISAKNDFVLEIDENYLDGLKNEKEEVTEKIDEIYKSNLKEKKMENNEDNNLSLNIKNISIGLYGGLDFNSIVDIKCKPADDNDNMNINDNKTKNKINESEDNKDNNINNDKKIILEENLNLNQEINKKKEQNFEIIEFNPYKKINGREKDNYLLFSIENMNLSILYVQKNSYEIEFNIQNFEINDNLRDSNFKRLLFAQKNISKSINLIEPKNNQFLSVFVDISNSQNELSANNYSDFNIICEIALASIQLLIHQKSLLFILDFFIQKNKSSSENNNDQKLKIYNKEQFHTERAYIEDFEFNEIILDDVEQSELLSDRNFFYITNFLFKEFNVNITYESNELGFSFQNIYIPIIPDLKNYDFLFNEIKYKGFVTLNQFTDFFVEHFFGQLSKSNIFFQLLKSLSWTQPIINIFGDFFDIFISPFQSYKKNQGFIHGLFKGLKKFFFNLLSKNVYAGEKMIRTLTTFIGVTKNNTIGRDSFYERYILTDEKKKIYNYLYK